jgi:hypothetical protein
MALKLMPFSHLMTLSISFSAASSLSVGVSRRWIDARLLKSDATR